MDIFITICWILLAYVLAGFSTYLIVCWYDYKFNNITYHDMEDTSDIVTFVLWPCVLAIVIFNLFIKGVAKICNPVRMAMYKIMDKAKEKKNAKMREMHGTRD